MTAKKIIIIGAGGHAAEIDDYIRFSNVLENSIKFQVQGFIDDNPDNYARYSFSAPLIGDISHHAIRDDCEYLMGIANLAFRKEIVEVFIKKGAKFTSYIHPHAYISESSKIGKGVVISYLANVGPNAEVGDFSMINARASISHDTKIGKYNFIGPNVCLSGNTRVGDENLFGVNSATIPEINIGDRNQISAGMTVNKNIENDATIFYKISDRILAIKK